MFSSVCSCFCTGPRGCPFSGVPFKGEPLVCFDGVSSFDLVLGAMANDAACSCSARVIRGPTTPLYNVQVLAPFVTDVQNKNAG